MNGTTVRGNSVAGWRVVSIHESLGWKVRSHDAAWRTEGCGKILHEDKMELLGAYCLNDDECADYAWSIFADAIEKAKDPQAILHWIGWQYADLGFFADAAEALCE